MVTNLIELTSSGALASVSTRHLLTMQLDVLPIVTVGDTPNGLRRVGIVRGGTVIGERISGRVVVGNDWQLLRPDGSLSLDVRLLLETDRGEHVTMTYRGLRYGPADVIARLDRGEAAEPATYYFRIAPMFESSGTNLAWLNDVQAVGLGHRLPAGPVYVVYEVL